eukprot:TRINITY_DN20_c0_g1_i3.p1 TRINITY_DN20_c0_g1~~TRINITY_DN20_c0_g1_i3.p1  ORF type:complete len:331 (+),score=116.33 TRINITY_DN20_c0_g1_i3:57-1049(+)
MSARAVALLCIATLAHAASYGVQKIPQFYTSSDCSGPIDPASKQWGLPAQQGGMVYPFAQEGAWLEMWAFDTCIAGNTTAYGMMLKIDETACSGNNAANQLQLRYYPGDRSCGTTPTVVPLTLNTCVAYPLGSVKLTPQLSTDDLCTATDYMVKLKQGGQLTEAWHGPGCSGAPVYSDVFTYGVKDCASKPECTGCCVQYDTATCAPYSPATYLFGKSACTQNGMTWRYKLNMDQYSDSGCTKRSDYMLNGKLVELGHCFDVQANGENTSYKMTYVAPMTVDVMCAYVEMALRNNLDPSFVTWDQLENGSAAGAVPQVLLLALLVAAVLM